VALALAAVFLLSSSSCFEMGGDMPHHSNSGRDTRSAAPVDAAGNTTVRIINYGFEPGNLRVSVGTAVTWRNLDAIGHTSTADAGEWSSTVLGQGEEWSYTFTEPGIYTYYCAPHPQMKAQVEVV
jgi:plastocyanin